MPLSAYKLKMFYVWSVKQHQNHMKKSRGINRLLDQPSTNTRNFFKFQFYFFCAFPFAYVKRLDLSSTAFRARSH